MNKKPLIISLIPLVGVTFAALNYFSNSPLVRVNSIEWQFVDDSEIQPRIEIENIGGRTAFSIQTNIFVAFIIQNQLMPAGIPVSQIDDLVPKTPLNIRTTSMRWNTSDFPDYYLVNFKYKDRWNPFAHKRHYFYTNANDPELGNNLVLVTDPNIKLLLEDLLNRSNDFLLTNSGDVLQFKIP